MESFFQNQVDTIRQSFGYVRQFRDSIFVIKIDSSLTRHPFFPIFIRDVVLLHNAGIKIVLIPGTRVRINEILESFGVESSSVNGVRITSEEAIPFVKMAAFDVSNQIMTMLAENSANAVIGNWIRARGIGVRDGVDYQSSGMIDKVDGDSIRGILDDNMIPIFPNIGWSLTGRPYNISSNELALRISSELQAEKLFFITESAGVSAEGLNLPKSVRVGEGGLVSQLTAREAEQILAAHVGSIYDNTALQTLKLAEQALGSGVNRVHVVDGRVDGVLLKEIFSNKGFGTMIYTGQFDQIRKAEHQDVPDILRITDSQVKRGVLIPRSAEVIEESIVEYVVYQVDNTVHGCGGLKEFSNNSAEIYSIAVDDSYSSMGVGKKIISYLITQAVERKFITLFLLTTQTTDWFIDRGFTEGSVDNLPAEKKAKYNYERMSKVLLLDLTNPKSYERLIGA